ncbi:putative oxidoreductase [Rhizomicrobium palustre]|uniref:Putative oxidoreductase n=1 Tax=Rhizomicrobium palustre TaxID=189966 RepID=A0A846MX41_9PROT|nr:DoxX family protein [Rhizomicrobium palustre]NIK87809.1 putative oxidoreductase [Rhizomicrobium palustre]
MSFSEKLSPLVGRLVFAWFFLVQVVTYAGDWENTITLMNFRGVPGAAFILALVLLLLVMGSISLIFGFHARYGALILFIVTIVATVTLNDYWRIPNAAERAAEFHRFVSNAAVAGGLLLLVGMGPGPLAVDNVKGGGGGKRK